MTSQWTSTRLGQTLIAIAVISLIYICTFYSPYAFILVPFYILLLPAGFKNPYFFCILFFILCIFRLHEINSAMTPFHFPLIFAILGILSLSINIHLGRVKVYWCKEMTCFLMFSILVSMGMLLSYDIQTSFDYWVNIYIKIFIAFFMITWSMINERAYKLVVSLIVLSGVTLSLLTLYNFVQGKELVEATRATLGGQSAVADPNDLALTLLFSFSFCCSILVNSSSFLSTRLSGFLSSIIIVAAILATQSRGGLLGLIIVISYFGTHKIKSKSFIIILGLILYLLFRSFFNRSTGAQGVGFDESALGRIYAWEAAINMAIHHPLFGVGINGFQDNLYNYAVVWENKQNAVHSSWFGVLAETGFPGLFLFIYCVFLAIQTAYKNIRFITIDHQLFEQETIYPILARGLFSGLMGFCVTSTFLTQGFTWPFYAFFALTVALSHSIKTKINAPLRTIR